MANDGLTAVKLAAPVDVAYPLKPIAQKFDADATSCSQNVNLFTIMLGLRAKSGNCVLLMVWIAGTLTPLFETDKMRHP